MTAICVRSGIHHQHGGIAHVQRSIGQIHGRRSRRDGTGTRDGLEAGANRVVAQVEAVRLARVQIKVGIENHAPRPSAAPGAVLLRRQLTSAVSASMDTAKNPTKINQQKSLAGDGKLGN